MTQIFKRCCFFNVSCHFSICLLRFAGVESNNKVISLVERRKSHRIKYNMGDFVYPNDQAIKMLDSENAFNTLTEKEKMYAHYLSRACWYGSHIGIFQRSFESPLIFVLLNKLFRAESISELKKRALTKCGFTEEDFQAFIVYASALYVNEGNYKHYGSSKFVPNLQKEKFAKLVLESKAASLQPEKYKKLLNNCIEKIFSLHNCEKQLDFPDTGVTTYLSKNVTKEDSDIITEFMKKQKFEPWNTRLFKSQDETGKTCYEIRVASILSTDDNEDSEFISQHVENSHKFTFTRGDYSPILKLINESLTRAKEYAANDIEVKMLESYIHHFRTGSIEAHKEGCRHWIRNKTPTVEMFIGFIETYNDPAKVRAEFEGFVAVVNKEISKQFQSLVKGADVFLPLLPWPKPYQANALIIPDFTSLDILTFSQEPPHGICVPNYADVSEIDGFKNVSLGNVVATKFKGIPANFLGPKDKEILIKYLMAFNEVSVGLHEFLGHGSSRLFMKKKNDEFDFDVNTLDLETNEKVSSWYEEGQTYYSVFGPISSSYEECRAECVAIYLSTFPEVLKVFGYKGQEAEEVMYAIWLSYAQKAVEGLAQYEPKTDTWLQAHRQANYVMLQVLLEAGDNFVNVKEVKGIDGKPDLLVTLDQSKILTVGKPAIGKFLQRLQLYRSTANATKGQAMYNKYSEVTCEGCYPFLNFREIVLARTRPRQMLIFGNTIIEDGKVVLKTYESSHEGNINSWLDRLKGVDLDDILEELWQKDQMYFS